MKVLLFTTDYESGRLIIQKIKKADHFVVETVDDPDQLILEIARTTPHLLVAHTLADSNLGQMIHEKVGILFPDLTLCMLNGNLSEKPMAWQKAIQELLIKPIKPKTPRPYADSDRYVLHDLSLQAFWAGKLNRPERKEGWERICSHQEVRFVLQLQTARKNHPAAKRYFECLVAQQAGLDQEISYRLAHGSFKALSWSRDLAIKWLALLAHYVPDAELEYLPLAGMPGPAVDYVHHHTPVEGMYAVTLVLLSRVKPSIDHEIKDLVISRFDGQDEQALLSLSLKLYGMAKWLEQVGRSQIELMDAWLDPAVVGRVDDHNIPRGEHRNAGIYRDFYDLTFIVNSPEPLASILKGFHAGTTYVPERRFLPSFSEFRRFCRDAKSSPKNPVGK
jgi:hypothetical protein